MGAACSYSLQIREGSKIVRLKNCRRSWSGMSIRVAIFHELLLPYLEDPEGQTQVALVLLGPEGARDFHGDQQLRFANQPIGQREGQFEGVLARANHSRGQRRTIDGDGYQ